MESSKSISNSNEKNEYRATIRFKPSEINKIESLRQVKKGKLEPFGKALHRFIKNAIYLEPKELSLVDETTNKYGIPVTPNNPKIAIMQFIEKANHHNGDNPSNPKQPASPKASKNTTKPKRTLPNRGDYKRKAMGRNYSMYTGFSMGSSEGLPRSYYDE